jgi:hypothetical protein
MWLNDLPVARVPSWQLTQLPVTPLWLNVAGTQAVVLWHVSHVSALRMWFVPLPVAVVPLWHVTQLPSTCV